MSFPAATKGIVPGPRSSDGLAGPAAGNDTVFGVVERA